MKIETKWEGAISVCVVVLAMPILAACGGTSEPEPVITISTEPTDLIAGNIISIQWSATDATSCMASGDWHGPRPINGSEQMTTRFGGKLLYKLSCTGPGGSTEKTATVISHRGVSPP